MPFFFPCLLACLALVGAMALLAKSKQARKDCNRL